MYKSFIDIIPEIQDVLTSHNISVENVDDSLYLIKHTNFCLKIYDKAGHGYSFNYAFSRKPNKKYYSDKEYVEYWFYKYINMEYKNETYDRTIEGYNRELNNFKESFDFIVHYLENMNNKYWKDLKQFIRNEINKDPIYKNYKYK